MIRKILLVCTGNTCRSPMAEALLRRRIEEVPRLKARVEVCSAGTSAGNGTPPTTQAVQVMKSRKIDISRHQSRPVHPSLFAWADLVLTMTADQKRACISRGAPENKVMTIGDFMGTGEEVEDPFGKELFAYEECARELEQLVERIVERLQEQDP